MQRDIVAMTFFLFAIGNLLLLSNSPQTRLREQWLAEQRWRRTWWKMPFVFWRAYFYQEPGEYHCFYGMFGQECKIWAWQDLRFAEWEWIAVGRGGAENLKSERKHHSSPFPIEHWLAVSSFPRSTPWPSRSDGFGTGQWTLCLRSIWKDDTCSSVYCTVVTVRQHTSAPPHNANTTNKSVCKHFLFKISGDIPVD